MKTQQDQVREALRACAEDARASGDTRRILERVALYDLAATITPEGALKLARLLKL